MLYVISCVSGELFKKSDRSLDLTNPADRAMREFFLVKKYGLCTFLDAIEKDKQVPYEWSASLQYVRDI